MRVPERILITGGSGSGKTYLASRIAVLLEFPYTSLDVLAYDFSSTHRFDRKRPLAERRALLDRVLARSVWIIEGGYFSDHQHVYDAADLIIYLRPSMPRRIANTFRRFIARIREGRYEGLGNFLRLTWYNLSTTAKWQRVRPVVFREKYGEKMALFPSGDAALSWFTQRYEVDP